MNLVECVDVVKAYRQGQVKVTALAGINLKIEKGGFVALAGPSGSGKTTLLNLIGGLDTPDSGSIAVDGRNYENLKQSQLAKLRLKKVGFIFQAYNLIPVLTARENVEFVMELQGVTPIERKKRAEEILEMVGLGEQAGRRPSELSGGQQQRVAVARAIVANPSLVLADEPTANLDSENGRSLLELMSRMNREKQVTFIFSTHDQMVMDHAERLVMLKDGLIAQDMDKTSQ
ncbi:ABC transporter ATP-binding protein [Dethiosulfatarculus sandiegensis]|uniref:Macrolide ABC transporter ATP-binding protein n=1 Tax=Dethiosulfatarculus sandiegensis TaxID=1429043 RepID=A0A0D2GFC4_9BACT|nr:ABC transporter ATP-binding protein [Dethiosulfatarculus sandiegensis]KIX13622.1 macrolide ABC transporter ATP-binding protein [Dethiosulfatarculus sandiegensis]